MNFYRMSSKIVFSYHFKCLAHCSMSKQWNMALGSRSYRVEWNSGTTFMGASLPLDSVRTSTERHHRSMEVRHNFIRHQRSQTHESCEMFPPILARKRSSTVRAGGKWNWKLRTWRRRYWKGQGIDVHSTLSNKNCIVISSRMPYLL